VAQATVAINMSFPADRTSLYWVRQFVRQSASSIELPHSPTDDLVLAVSEACSMVLCHSLNPVIRMSWEFGGNELKITVEDDGPIDSFSLHQPLLSTQYALINEQVDELDITELERSGRPVIRMRKRILQGAG
jgi:anti-sigma regulatory factor (Ser/Thr protein kinase)